MYKIRFRITLLLYTIACILFLINSSSVLLNLLGISILFVSVPLKKADFGYALSILPFAFLLGPVFLIPVGAISVNISDVLLFIDFILFVLYFKNDLKFKLKVINFLVLILLLLSTFLSISIKSSFVTNVLILQWLFYYIMCKHCFTSEASFHEVIPKWSYAVTLGSFLVIVSFFIGKPLILNSQSDTESFKDMREGASVYLRASYFITSFIYVNACILITYFLKLVKESKGNNVLYQFNDMIIFSVNLLCALLMQNKTELFTVLIIFLIIIMILIRNRRYLKRIILLVLCFAILVITTFGLIVNVVGEEQLDFFVERIYDNDSYNARVPIWNNVSEYVFKNPKVLLIGIGPDISIRLSDGNFFDDLFSYKGIREFAVDSNYLTFLLNYGLLLTLFFFGKVISLLKIAFSNRLTAQTKSFIIFPIIAWLLMGVTQLHGISKPGFLLVFYLSIGFNLLKNNKNQNFSYIR